MDDIAGMKHPLGLHAHTSVWSRWESGPPETKGYNEMKRAEVDSVMLELTAILITWSHLS